MKWYYFTTLSLLVHIIICYWNQLSHYFHKLIYTLKYGEMPFLPFKNAILNGMIKININWKFEKSQVPNSLIDTNGVSTQHGS